MARKTKTIQLEEREKPITIYELTVGQIIHLAEDDGPFSRTGNNKGLKGILDSDLLQVCSTLKFEDLLNFTPSELKQIWDAFREVNKTFFETARQVGLTGLLEEMMEKFKGSIQNLMQEELSKLLAGSSRPVIQESSTTDTPT